MFMLIVNHSYEIFYVKRPLILGSENSRTICDVDIYFALKKKDREMIKITWVMAGIFRKHIFLIGHEFRALI